MKQKVQSKKTKRVQVTFSPKTYKIISDKAEILGLPITEYIRYSALNIPNSSDYIEMLDEDSSKELGEALQDVKMGRVTKGMKLEEALDFLKKYDENN